MKHLNSLFIFCLFFLLVSCAESSNNEITDTSNQTQINNPENSDGGNSGDIGGSSENTDTNNQPQINNPENSNGENNGNISGSGENTDTNNQPQINNPENSNSGNSGNTSGNNTQHGQEHPFYLHNINNGLTNILPYNNDKMLITNIYYTNNTANISPEFTISSSKAEVNKTTNMPHYRNYVKGLDNKERLHIHIQELENQVRNAGIQPVNTQSNAYSKNINYKSSVPSNITIGTKWNNIYVTNMAGAGYKTINAECIAVSEHAYFFLEEGLSNLTQEQIEDITKSFDKDYEIVHKYFGSESDIDKNGKVSFLITDLPNGVMGFFFSLDKYYDTQLYGINQHSNEADLLYVNHSYFQENQWQTQRTNVIATFIHEFQHMTFFDTRTKNKLQTGTDRWLNEGLSMLSEYYGGYGTAHYNYVSGYFHQAQGSSLVTESTGLDYGLELLFTRYLQARFGDEFIKTIYSSVYTGKKAVEEAVKMDFDLLYSDFVKMITVTGRNITTDKRYNIEAFNYPKGSQQYKQNGFNISDIINTVYSYNHRNNYFITENGYTTYLNPYSFMLTKWYGTYKNIKLDTKNNNIYGVYTAW